MALRRFCQPGIFLQHTHHANTVITASGLNRAASRRLVSSIAKQQRNSWKQHRQSHTHHGSRSSAYYAKHWLVALVPLGLSPVIRLDDGTSPGMTSQSQSSRSQKAALQHIDLEEEPNPSIFRRIWAFFNRWIFEPLGTTRRFLYLASVFLPVIITAPVLALEWVGTEVKAGSGRKQKRKQERITTKWWYWLLVKQMERAGPTFIKVNILYWSFSRHG